MSEIPNLRRTQGIHSCGVREHDGINKAIVKLGLGMPIMPDPELGQDVAFLGHVITELQRRVKSLEALSKGDQAPQKREEPRAAAELRLKATTILEIAHGLRHMMGENPSLFSAYELLEKATNKLAAKVRGLDERSTAEDLLEGLQDLFHVMGMCQIATEFMKLFVKETRS